MAVSPRFKLFDGPITLAGNFPPTLNKDADRTKLQVNESPDAYGIDWDVEGIMTPGSVPTGTARVAPVGTGSYTGWNWYYNRLMKTNTDDASQIDIGAPEYRAFYYEQDVGSRTGSATIVTFMPALQQSLVIVTATGSYMMGNMLDTRGFFYLNDFEQGFFASASARVVTLQGIPYVCNAKGVFSWDGQQVTEVTRPVRNNIAPFADVAILSDYDERLVIGTSKFVIDTLTDRLFDYSSSGFKFTSRTLAQPSSTGVQPFDVDSVAFLFDISSSDRQTIKWETKTDNGGWKSEPNIIVADKEKRIVRAVENPITTCREFTMRITSATSGVRIREIQAVVRRLNQETITE